MYKTVFEWAVKNGYPGDAAKLARFFDEGGHAVNNQNAWRKAIEWWEQEHNLGGVAFANKAQEFSDWLKEVTTNRW